MQEGINQLLIDQRSRNVYLVLLDGCVESEQLSSHKLASQAITAAQEAQLLQLLLALMEPLLMHIIRHLPQAARLVLQVLRAVPEQEVQFAQLDVLLAFSVQASLEVRI